MIYGNLKCGIGILNNEFYVGKFVWNCLCYIKDFDIGWCVFCLNLESEWVVYEVFDLWFIE